jgi:hypothetical protein
VALVGVDFKGVAQTFWVCTGYAQTFWIRSGYAQTGRTADALS